MSATYWVLLSAELVRAGITWPAGLRMTGQPVPQLAVAPSGSEAWTPVGDMRWCAIEDDGAPPGLQGRQVELVFRSEDGRPALAERRVIM